MSKRKASVDRTEPPTKKVGQKGNCIVHTKDSNLEQFLFFSDINEPDERFRRIQEIRDRRLAQAAESPYRMEKVCELIPVNLSDNDGYHRDCYQKFTMNLSRLKPATSGPTPAPAEPSSSRPKRGSSEPVLFEPNCIFCSSFTTKKVKRRSSWTTEGLSNFEYGGGATVIKLAEVRNDETLLRRIRGMDLFACEAKYHQSCRQRYQDPDKWRSGDVEETEREQELIDAHNKSFSKLCQVIDERILQGKEVIKFTDLRDMYINFLSETPCGNPDYRSSRLKSRLKRHEIYANKLSYVTLDRQGGQLSSELVFSVETSLSDAVKSGYMAGCADEIADVGNLLHDVITDAFKKSDELPWPPTASDLQNVDDPVPADLRRFLQIVITGGSSSPVPSEKTSRLVSSIGQDLCRAATHGQWKLPKHILVCMTLRHMFRSAKLSHLLNRLGHAESYSFALELETALAAALDEASSLITPQIIRNPPEGSLFHSDFDNFDQYVSDVSGSGSVHTAHGIMLQDIVGLPQMESTHNEGPIMSIPKTGARSLKTITHDSLPPCYITQRESPKMTIVRTALPAYEEAYSKALTVNLTWCLLRFHCARKQVVPAWAGFISQTGKKPDRLTTIDYYPVINHPITENATVQECLRVSRQAATEVGQKYAITTFDLGVCMKAYPIIWKSPEYYSDHIVMIGSFHLCSAYLKMVGKKMSGSGFTDVLIESGMMSTGSMEGVVSGKNYSRSIHCHKVMVEALEQLLMTRYHKDTGVLPMSDTESKTKVDHFLQFMGKQELENLVTDKAVGRGLAAYIAFREGVRQGSLGKTAQFWLTYVDHIWLVLSLLQSVKTNDYLLYGSCLFQMADLFFSFDGQNYARYLTYFSTFLANIDETHPGATDLLKMGAISVARSFVPGNLCAVDKTIEETFMRHAKSHGSGARGAGVSGLLQNYQAYRRWARTAHERSKYVEVMLQSADMTDEGGGTTHRDVRPSMIKRSEKTTSKVVEAFQSFMDPFGIEEDGKLYCIASGATAPADIESDIVNAEASGKSAKDSFVEERLMENKEFFAPIKRQRLKTFADMGKAAKLKTTSNKEVLYKQQSNVAFQLLVKSQDQPERIELRELMKYPLMPVPSSIGTADGRLLKTDKSKGFHYLTQDTEDAVLPPDERTMNIEDGNATFYTLKEVPGTFRQISEKIFDVSTGHKSSIIFSTDMYKDTSIKSLERSTRGCGEKRIVSGENTRRPEKWKDFLSNDANKQQLIQLILKVWSSPTFAHKLQGKVVIVVCEEKAFELKLDEEGSILRTEVSRLQSDQEETDTRVVLYCTFAAEKGYEFVKVRSPDSDIFFILMYYAPNLNITILFDTGAGNKRRLINISKLAKDFTPGYCDALMGLHAFTRCDTTSAFKGIGKLKPIKLLQKTPRYQQVFIDLGRSWCPSEDLLLQLEQFTCKMYRPRSEKMGITEVDQLRHSMLTERCGGVGTKLDAKKNIDLSSLPPPRVCLREHIKRANFQVGIWKRSHVQNPEIPSPVVDNGWVMVGENIEPKWCDGDILPSKLADILEDMEHEGESSESESESDNSGSDSESDDESDSD